MFADRPCAAIDWAIDAGLDTAIVPAPVLSDGSGRTAWDAALAETLEAVAPDVIVLAGFMRVLGPAVLAAFPGRILNTHPALAPAFPGAHAVGDALAAGAVLSGATVHLVDATLDGGPIVLQEAVPILPGDDVAAVQARIQAVEHRLLPRAAGLLLAGAVHLQQGRVTLDSDWAESHLPVPRRALLSVSDKAGLEELGRGLVALGFELVSTGGTAGALRAAGLAVTDVAALTGVPEMLDGRVKTLHPRIHAGILADRRRPEHRRQLVAAGIALFELVVINLYPFAAAADRTGISFDELIEEIDIGGPSLVRAAAKNHASVAVMTSPERYPAILEALALPGGVPIGLRAALAIEAFRHTAAYDARIAAALPVRMAEAGIALPDEPGLPGAADPYPRSLTVTLEKVETLRYGENPHQPAARYRVPGSGAAAGPFASGAAPLQGKALSYNNVLDASAAAALARSLPGPASVIVKHTNPCGAAERPSLLEAWHAALSGDPISAFGGVVALTGSVDGPLAEALAAIFLEVVVAPAFEPAALEILAGRPNLRLIVDPTLAGAGEAASSPDPSGRAPDGRRSSPRDEPRRRDRRSRRLAGRHEPRADRGRIARPRPRLAPRAGCDEQCDRPRPRSAPDRPRLGPDESRRCGPAGRREGAGGLGPGVHDRCGVRVRCLLPLPGWRRGLPRGRRWGVRPAGRLDPRPGRDRRRGGRRSHHGPDRGASFPALNRASTAPAALRLGVGLEFGSSP